jgi:integrase
MKGQERMLCILAAASGLRIGELSGLEIKHFVGNVLQVEQTVRKGDVQAQGKSKSFFRQVDLQSSVATMVREFIGERKEGFIFRYAQRNSYTSIKLPAEGLAPRFGKA